MDYAFPARLTPEEHGYTVTFRDVPPAITHGETREEAIREAHDCLDGGIAIMIESGDPLPTPSPPEPGEVLVPVPVLMAAKLALHQAMRARGLAGPEDLARVLGCRVKLAARLLDPEHPSRIDDVVQAVRATGGPALALRAREVA